MLPVRVIDLAEQFEVFMKEFETTVLAAAVSAGVMGRREQLPVRPGKLFRTAFGVKLGSSFESSVSFAVDYYGHLKKSTALLQEVAWLREQLRGQQVKSVEGVVVHFASVRMEDVAKYNATLVGGFPTFKKAVLDARGFKNNF